MSLSIVTWCFFPYCPFTYILNETDNVIFSVMFAVHIIMTRSMSYEVKKWIWVTSAYSVNVALYS